MSVQITQEMAAALLNAVESGSQNDVESIAMQISQMHDESLQKKLSELTANLHETLAQIDGSNLLDQTKNDLPDAAERLEYVLQKTEEASSTTMQLAESALAKIDDIEGPAAETLKEVHRDLTEIILAQAYQDLTGQVLKRVMVIIASLETSLIALIEQSGHDYSAIPKRNSEASQSQLDKGMGPDIHQQASQDDVDDLLDELGI